MNGNRHKTQMMGDETDEPDEEIVNEFASAVETCLERRKEIEPVLTDIRQAQLQGEPVQDQIDALCESEPALFRLGLTAKTMQIPQILAVAEARGKLSEADANDFETFWDRNDWITEGVYAHFLNEQHDCTYWTGGSLDIETRDGVNYVHHSFDWGLDEVHDIEAPLAETWDDLVNRLMALVKISTSDQFDLNETERELLQESTPKLQQIARVVAEVSGEDEDSDDGSANEATDLGKHLEEHSGDGDQEEPEKTADESLIGFQ
ncbi:hypothetical protein ACOJIV_18155 [Haloarcula sp. AONF1]